MDMEGRNKEKADPEHPTSKPFLENLLGHGSYPLPVPGSSPSFSEFGDRGLRELLCVPGCGKGRGEGEGGATGNGGSLPASPASPPAF